MSFWWLLLILIVHLSFINCGLIEALLRCISGESIEADPLTPLPANTPATTRRPQGKGDRVIIYHTQPESSRLIEPVIIQRSVDDMNVDFGSRGMQRNADISTQFHIKFGTKLELLNERHHSDKKRIPLILKSILVYLRGYLSSSSAQTFETFEESKLKFRVEILNSEQAKAFKFAKDASDIRLANSLLLKFFWELPHTFHSNGAELTENVSTIAAIFTAQTEIVFTVYDYLFQYLYDLGRNAPHPQAAFSAISGVFGPILIRPHVNPRQVTSNANIVAYILTNYADICRATILLREKLQFDVSIEKLLQYERHQNTVPAILIEFTTFLTDIDRLETEGILRKSSTKVDADAYIVRLNKRENIYEDLEVNGQTMFDIGSLFKEFIKRLPNNLLPNEVLLIDVEPGIDTDEDIQRNIAGYLKQLTDHEFAFLSYIVDFFHTIQAHSTSNKMDFANIGVVLAPDIFANILDIAFPSNVSSKKYNPVNITHAIGPKVVAYVVKHFKKICALM